MGTVLNIRTQVFVPWEAANAVTYPVPPDGVGQEEWSRARFSAMLAAWPQGNNVAVGLVDEWACRFALYQHEPGSVATEWRSSIGPVAMRVNPYARVYDMVDVLHTGPVSLHLNVGRACAQSLAGFENPQTGPGGHFTPNTVAQNIGESIAATSLVQASGLAPAVAEVFGVDTASPTAPAAAKPNPFAGILKAVAVIGGIIIGALILAGDKRR